MTVEVEPEGEKEHHELAKPLADLLGMKHESRANILQALFTYIRLHKLQVGQLLARCRGDPEDFWTRLACITHASQLKGSNETGA